MRMIVRSFIPMTAVNRLGLITKLLFDCKHCKKPISANNQTFCMGCGEKIFVNPGFNSMDEYFKKYGWNNFKFGSIKINHPTLTVCLID